ncbi:hypothetical protein MP638_003006 [Amoeboaphelidium occidentale]|nr:hypothetical protein MP638_003006 [Amoeboaphelidium occidentale]
MFRPAYDNFRELTSAVGIKDNSKIDIDGLCVELEYLLKGAYDSGVDYKPDTEEGGLYNDFITTALTNLSATPFKQERSNGNVHDGGPEDKKATAMELLFLLILKTKYFKFMEFPLVLVFLYEYSMDAKYNLKSLLSDRVAAMNNDFKDAVERLITSVRGFIKRQGKSSKANSRDSLTQKENYHDRMEFLYDGITYFDCYIRRLEPDAVLFDLETFDDICQLYGILGTYIFAGDESHNYWETLEPVKLCILRFLNTFLDYCFFKRVDGAESANELASYLGKMISESGKSDGDQDLTVNMLMMDFEEKYQLRKKLSGLQSNTSIQQFVEKLNVAIPAENFDSNVPTRRNSFQGDQPDDLEMVQKLSQLKDLFSEFSDYYLRKCLEYYHHDPELCIQAILEEQLPPELANMSRTASPPKDLLKVEKEELPSYDQVYKGKSKIDREVGNFDQNISIDEIAKNKIISKYSVYDDECNDEFEPNRPLEDEENPETILLHYYTKSKDVFERNARNSNDRKELLKNLGQITGDTWTDEQVEGWRSVFERKPESERDKILNDFHLLAFSNLSLEKQEDVEEDDATEEQTGDNKPSQNSGDNQSSRGGSSSRGRGRGGRRGMKRGHRGRGTKRVVNLMD